MALSAEIATYLAGQSLGLSLGASGNLFAMPIPDRAPAAAVCVVEYAGMASERAFGASIGSPVCEVRRFQVTTRSSDFDSFSAAQALAQNITNKLDHLADATLSGVRYLYIEALQQPFYLGEDENGRHLFVNNFEARRERG